MKLSVVLAVYNEETNLAKCLQSVADIASEIVIVDGGSSDDTVKIAESFGARIIRTGNPSNFHINKEIALKSAKYDWVLQLDADEVIPDALRKEIEAVVNDGNSEVNGYKIIRRNYFWGKFMKKGGLYPDMVIRLVRRGKAHFPCRSVHEQIHIVGLVSSLKEPMEHYAYRTMNDYWRKANQYISLTAKTIATENIRTPHALWFEYSVIRPIKTFFSIYIRHKGFLDSWQGLVFAAFSALHYPLAYQKYIISSKGKSS